MAKQFAVFAHRGDGRYHLKDCKGCKVWKRENAAQAFADMLNQDSAALAHAPQGYVVRPSDYYSDTDCDVTTQGRVYYHGSEQTA